MDVEISNPAMNIIATIHDRDPVGVLSTIETVKRLVREEAQPILLNGYSNMFATRGDGLRVIYRTEGGQAVVTLVAAEGDPT